MNTVARLAHCTLVAAIFIGPMPVHAQTGPSGVESRVAELFANRCTGAGCHSGPVPQQGLELTRERFYATSVGEPSVERPELLRVNPGQPEISYLMMKVKGDPGIIGVQMPFTGDKLTDEEIDLIRQWIASIDEVDESRKQAAPPSEVFPFYGWRIVNLPTARVIEKKRVLFEISHRFNSSVRSGVDNFWGIDGPGIIYLALGYAVTDELFFSLGRSNSNDNVELSGRYLFGRQEPGGGWTGPGWPADLALRAAINWVSEAPLGDESRVRSEAFKFSAQLVLARQVTEGLGVAFVPGILTNPAEEVDGEDPQITLGLGARWRLSRHLALIAEWVPIASGYVRTTTFGNDIRFDSWGGGLEIRTTAHVFQIVLSNTVGLTSDQYLRGGDLDITEPDVRLGFNIHRILTFWP
jgi:hypothetical protein